MPVHEEVREEKRERVPEGEVVKERRAVAPVAEENRGFYIVRRIIDYVFWILEILLAFRLILKLLGANPGSGFVSFIYSVTEVLVAPFRGIFSPAGGQGAETVAVFEPATLIAMIVYALIAWLIIWLIGIVQNARKRRDYY